MRTMTLLAAGFVAAPVAAGTISVTIPQLSVAEYHKPYVAAWLEPADGGAARTLFVWYDTKDRGKEPGVKWLADMRTWWRKGGRSLTLPADGISGATRAPGTYQVPIPTDLKSGKYTLFVEAARETGGRELVSLPLSVPTVTAQAAGTAELGAVAISAR